MGVVYRADDLALERPVAVKMLRPDLAEDHVFIERLRAEAVLLARIQHPNLVQICHFGQAGGDSYFVMELVEGASLQEAIERHETERTPAPPLAVIIAVIEEVASALDALGEREHEWWTQTEASEGYAGSSLTGARDGKAPSDRPALKPYWGNPPYGSLEGREETEAMAKLNGHEAGNGGYSQART